MHDPETASSHVTSSHSSMSKAQKWVVGCGGFVFLLLLTAGLVLRFWTFESKEDFSTPARPPTQLTFDPGPGMPAEYDQVVAVPQVGEPGWIRKGSLAWEIVRQGVLIAAEQELGLSTLDPSMGPKIPFIDPPHSFPVMVQMLASSRAHPDSKPGGPQLPAQAYFSIEVTRGRPASPAFRWTAPEVIFRQDRLHESLAERMDALAAGPLRDALTAAGFSKSTPLTGDTSDSGREPQISDHMDVVGQFGLLRHYHSQMVAQGESQQTLGALTRTYANLGSLTDFHWGSSSKAFKARSLVYSQRLVRKYGKSAFSHAHEAYALALAGRHASALESIRLSRMDSKSQAPQWLGLIEAYCLYEPDKLAGLEGPQLELACYLRMRMADIVNDQDRALQAIIQFQQINPACGRATEMLAEADSLDLKQKLASDLYPKLRSAICQRLASMPELPASARDIAATADQQPASDADSQYAAWENLIVSLRNTSAKEIPSGIPPWTVLSELLSDESFLQAWRMLDVEANWLKHKADPLLGELLPLYNGHRYATFLNCFVSDKNKARDNLQSFFKSLDPQVLDTAAIPIAREIEKRLGFAINRPFVSILESHSDNLYEDMGPRYAWEFKWFGPGKQLYDISPHWPLSAAEKIRSDGERNIVSVEEQEATARAFPAVLNALGKRYLELERVPDAIRLFDKSIAVAPGYPACRALASLYHEEGNFEKWSQTLEQALVINNSARDAVQVHADLADAYMRHAAWDKAEPHVAAVMKEATEEGFQLATRCAEGQEDWDQAEAAVRELSKRYPQCANDWYFWCTRTGHGNQEAALSFAKQELTGVTVQSPPKMYWSIATRQFLTGDAALAEVTLRDAHVHLGNSLAGNLAALLYDARGRSSERDALFIRVGQAWTPPEGYQTDQNNPANRGKRQKDPFPELTNLMMFAIAHGRWSANDFELHVVESDRAATPSLYLVAGMFLCQHDQKDLGHEYLQRAIAFPSIHRFMGVLAAKSLRQDGVEIRKPQLRETPDSMAPLVSLVKRFTYHYQRNHLARAEKVIEELQNAAPQFLPGLMARGQLLEARGAYSDAIAVYEEALRLDPDYSRAHYKLAWLLSDCDVAEFRNGAKALSHANRYVSLRRLPTYVSVSTLAVAFAENGNFPMAVRLEEQALSLPGFLNLTSEQLGRYQSGQPYRRPPADKRYAELTEIEAAGNDL